jgi:hypothetical protein
MDDSVKHHKVLPETEDIDLGKKPRSISGPQLPLSSVAARTTKSASLSTQDRGTAHANQRAQVSTEPLRESDSSSTSSSHKSTHANLFEKLTVGKQATDSVQVHEDSHPDSSSPGDETPNGRAGEQIDGMGATKLLNVQRQTTAFPTEAEGSALSVKTSENGEVSQSHISSEIFRDKDRKPPGDVPEVASVDSRTKFFALPSSARRTAHEESSSRKEGLSPEGAEPIDSFTQLLHSISSMKKMDQPRFTPIKSSHEQRTTDESARLVSRSSFKGIEWRDKEAIAQPAAAVQLGAESDSMSTPSCKAQATTYRLLLSLAFLNLCSTILLLAMGAYIFFHFRG